MPMKDHYATLGLNSSASIEEIRRAYRILARRYHPDVNPGKASEERFRLIAEAYSVLSDLDKRRSYDLEYEARLRRGEFATYTAQGRPQHRDAYSARRRFYEAKYQNFGKVRTEAPPQPPPQAPLHTPPSADQSPWWDQMRRGIERTFKAISSGISMARSETEHLSGGLDRESAQSAGPDQGPISNARRPEPKTARVKKISLLEVSITMRDAILGVKKSVEVSDTEESYKVSLNIPPGMRNGNVLRTRSPASIHEDLVFIIRVAQHPFLTIQNKGLVVELPISLDEAINGATVTIPTLDKPAVVTIPPGSQSGTEIRLKQYGIRGSDGSRGDLFFRLNIQVPTCWQAIGIKEKVHDLSMYYEGNVRHSFPTQNLLEQAT